MKPNPSPRRPAPAADREGLVLEHFLPYRLSVLMLRISSAIARSYERRFRLSVPEWRVMAVLGWFGPLSASGVAEKTQMDKGRVSRRIDRMDRRRSILSLTPAGSAIHREIVPHARRVEARLLAGLSDAERDTLDRLLAKLEARAETPFVAEAD